ncbi:hypothetical protein C0J52_06238, partial [Blattella germanica]
FNTDLCAALTQVGIPLNKINHPSFKGFLEKYTKMSVPDESTLRKNYMEPVYQETIQRIKEKVSNCDVGIMLDETTDSMERYVLNILVFPLAGEKVKPMLLKMYELQKANASTVMQSIMDFFQKLWPSGTEFEKVLLVVTDQAPYMLSAIKQLKPLLKHVTCLAHALHRVCESMRNEYNIANEFISALKKILLKARVVLLPTGKSLACPFRTSRSLLAGDHGLCVLLCCVRILTKLRSLCFLWIQPTQLQFPMRRNFCYQRKYIICRQNYFVSILNSTCLQQLNNWKNKVSKRKNNGIFLLL